jgi:hypothetical protein
MIGTQTKYDRAAGQGSIPPTVAELEKVRDRFIFVGSAWQSYAGFGKRSRCSRYTITADRHPEFLSLRYKQKSPSA